MWRKCGAVGAIVAAAALTLGAAPQSVSQSSALAIAQWVDAVRRHDPGQADPSVHFVHALSSSDRSALTRGLETLLAVLTQPPDQLVSASASGRAIVQAPSDPAGEARTPVLPSARVRAIARDLALTMGRRAFLIRAAMLHADAAMAPMAVAPADRPAREQSLPLARDGEVVGVITASWNWPFARDLIDRADPHPVQDPVVAAWYHATTAYFLWHGRYSEVRAHLERALAIAPDAARLALDRGTWSEALGMPFGQQLGTDEDRLAARMAREPAPTVAGATQVGRSMPDPPGPGPFGAIPSADVANRDAERWYRFALDRDATLAEAHVRLARLLMIRGQSAAAMDEVRRGLALAPAEDPVVAYWAHLFGARLEAARGAGPAAWAHVEQALALFPGAQSGLLEQSRIAFGAADRAAALQALARLESSATSPTDQADPWWLYHSGAGRQLDALLGALAREVAILAR